MMGCRAAVRVLNMLVGDRTGRESGGGSSAAPEGMEMDSELDQSLPGTSVVVLWVWVGLRIRAGQAQAGSLGGTAEARVAAGAR